jgi:hypothetical protein
MTSYCLAYWAPTYFMEEFGLSAVATGTYLGSTHLISMVGCRAARAGSLAGSPEPFIPGSIAP